MGGRYQKNYVDYFSHDTRRRPGNAVDAMEGVFGNDGYAAFWKIIERVMGSDGLYVDCSIDAEWLQLLGTLKVSEEKATAIIAMMVRLGVLDKDLWVERHILWAQGFVDRVKDAFRNRVGKDVPGKPVFPSSSPRKEDAAATEKPKTDTENHAGNDTETISDASAGNGISSLKRKGIEAKEINTTTLSFSENKTDGAKASPSAGIPYTEIVECLNSCSGQKFRASSNATQKVINGRWRDDGYRMSDFSKVIKYKCKEWRHTDKEKHLNPGTLFAPKHFETYLQQALLREKIRVPLMPSSRIGMKTTPSLMAPSRPAYVTWKQMAISVVSFTWKRAVFTVSKNSRPFTGS